MKKIIIGGFLLLVGILLYIGVHLSAAIVMTEIKGWSTPPGRFGTAIEEIGGETEVFLSKVLCLIGIGFMFWETCADKYYSIKNKQNIKQKLEKPEDEKILV